MPSFLSAGKCVKIVIMHMLALTQFASPCLQDQTKLQPTQRGWIHIQNRAAGHLYAHHEADPGLHIQWRGDVSDYLNTYTCVCECEKSLSNLLSDSRSL